MAKSSPTSLWLWLALAAVIVLADQFTKTLIIAAFDQIGRASCRGRV